MPTAGKRKSKSATGQGQMSCCSVQAVVAVDDRGQMVLPKELREKMNIKGGDKLALVSWDSDGEPCCVALVKVDRLAGMVKDLLGPMIKDVVS